MAARGESPGRARSRGADDEVWRDGGATADRRVSIVSAGDPVTAHQPHSDAALHSTQGGGAPHAKPIAIHKPPAGLEWLASGARRGNSNNWVLAGGRTKAGRPILANDPHLQIEFPSVWYEMHLVASGLDVIGVTIPGVPFIALGHNARIAWGMTATGADVQDLALERVDVGKKRSMYRGEWVPIETVTADIPVRGRSVPLPFEVWKTRNGPIFADVDLDWEAPPSWLSPDGRPADERRAYSIRWDTGGDLADGVRGDQSRQRLDVVHRRDCRRSPCRR